MYAYASTLHTAQSFSLVFKSWTITLNVSKYNNVKYIHKKQAQMSIKQ